MLRIKKIIKITSVAIGITFLSSATLSALAQETSALKTKTVTDLKKAYLGETTACGKYGVYATVAQKEHLLGVAHLFRATSNAEAIHARNHAHVLTTLGVSDPESGSYTDISHATRENLKEAVKGESYERDTMYPQMLKDAYEEKQQGAVQTFTFANKAEQQHAALYSAALVSLSKKQPGTTAVGAYFVCQNCGATYFGKAPARCRSCNASKSHILAIE